MIRQPTEEEITTILPKVARGWSNFEHENESGKGFFFSTEQIEGEIPRDLNATFVRNGPGLTVVHGTPLAHPIDGDGLVAKLTFEAGKCFFQCKFVQSKMHQEETKAKSILYNGSMGTRIPKTAGVKPKPGFRDPGHTNVFYAGQKLFAAYEYTLPHAMDPNTLDTFGPTSLNNELELKAMSAHFKVDYAKKRLVTVAFKAGNPMAPESKISFYEWSNDAEMCLESCARLTLDSVNYAHDFVLTPNWYVVHVTPFVDTTKETFKRIVKGELAPGETMRYCPELPSQFVLIERQQPENGQRRVIRMETEPCHIFHYANCRETADGMIAFEACCLPPGFTMQWQHKAFLSNSADAPGVMHTYLCDVNKQTLTRSTLPGLETTSCEFPTVHPYRNCVALDQPQVSTRYFYLMGSRPGQALPFSDVIKYDTLTKTQKRWRSEFGVVGEPCFMPRLGERSVLEGDEDDGYVICQVYLFEEQRNQFVVLDAKNLNVVCKLNLPFHLPYGFHGTYTDKIALPQSKL